MLRNAIRWATNEAPPVEVDGPGVLDVTIWRQRDSMSGSSREPDEPDDDEGAAAQARPLSDPNAMRIRLPAGTRARRVQLLTAKTTPRVDEEKGALVVTVPSIDAHEVVAVGCDGTRSQAYGSRLKAQGSRSVDQSVDVPRP